MIFDKRVSTFENVKANSVSKNIAKNRWGNKFRKLYALYVDGSGRFDFTSGMLNCVGEDIGGIIEELSTLRSDLNSLCQLSDGDFARNSSYFSILVKKNYMEIPSIKDIKVSISMSGSDHRATSIFLHKNNLSSKSNAFLEPILSYYERKKAVEDSTGYQKPFSSKNPFLVHNKFGNSYGYIDNTYTFPTATFDTVHDVLGVEEVDNVAFLDKSEYETKFENLLESLEPYLKRFLTVSVVLENHNSFNSDVVVVYPVNALDFWLKEIYDSYVGYFYRLGERTVKELELIEHLGLCATLQEQIGGKAGEVGSIWIELKKSVNAPSLTPDCAIGGYDPAYQWWNEEQFQKIRKKWKDFYIHFVYDTTTSNVFFRKESLSTLSGKKIFYIVESFLMVDSRAKKRSFLESLFSVVLLAVSIYLIAISGNPLWLKILFIASATLSYSGALSPNARLIMGLITLAYGAYSAELTQMTTLEVLQWSIEHIDVILELAQYKSNKVEDEKMEANEKNEANERAIKFIYDDMYDSFFVYDELTSVNVDSIY